MKILFFGRYDPFYSRNAVLLSGLRFSGVEVIECRVNPSSSLWPLRLLWRFLCMQPHFDVMIVAFPGQEVMPLARLLTRKPIIFDAFTSHYEGYVQDRNKISSGSLRARWYWFIDRLSCRLATMILTDTREHAKYFSQTFKIPQRKLFSLLLGTVLISGTSEPPVEEPLVVHFHGTNIPLQGVEVIWDAIRLLRNEEVRFQMIGPFEVPQELQNRVAHERSVPFTELAARMARAHVCLGIFGDTAKAQRVIPNKVYEALAMERPVITADTPAVRELLGDGDALLIQSANARALADAILLLKSDSGLRDRIAKAGLARLRERATPAIVGAQLIDMYERFTLRT